MPNARDVKPFALYVTFTNMQQSKEVYKGTIPRSKVAGSIPSNPSNFSTLDFKKSVCIIVKICSDHRLLWRYSYKGIDPALTPDESALHKIVIVIFMSERFKFCACSCKRDQQGNKCRRHTRILVLRFKIQ